MYLCDNVTLFYSCIFDCLKTIVYNNNNFVSDLELKHPYSDVISLCVVTVVGFLLNVRGSSFQGNSIYNTNTTEKMS